MRIRRKPAMTQPRFQTNWSLWSVFSAAGFIALSFVNPIADVAKGNHTLWAYIVRFMTGDYACSTSAILAPILMRSAFQFAAAALLGWVLQAVIVVLRDSRNSAKNTAQGIS
jgi:hypothetical protein